MIVQKRTYRKKRAQRYVEKKEGIRQMVYVTGDTHGEWERFKSKEMRKLRAGDTLVICGDFGFIWDDSRRERSCLRKLPARGSAV